MLSGISLLAGLACISHALSNPTGVEAQVPLQPETQKQQPAEASMLLEFLDAVKAQNDDLSINGGAVAIPLYSGIATFAHLDNVNCFSNETDGKFDIGVVGMPFDLGVTYRPGARFGPGAARMASRRLSPFVYDMDHENGAFNNWATVVDCGDIPNTPFDKLKAIEQLTHGSKSILSRAPKSEEHGKAVRMLSIGGDHTITLPVLRALRQIWGPVSVLHFDAHLDTWNPDQLSSGDEPSDVSDMTHGTMLHLAHEEGHMSNDSNYHVGSRCSLMSKFEDLDNDARCGFKYIRARQIDSIGIQGVIDRIAERVGDNYVYVSVDIDVLDPAFAPATGTAEPGGLTTRELLQILQGLSARGLKIVGADVVELSPPFDSIAEVTALAYVQVAYELLHWMVSVPVKTPNRSKE